MHISSTAHQLHYGTYHQGCHDTLQVLLFTCTHLPMQLVVFSDSWAPIVFDLALTGKSCLLPSPLQHISGEGG